MNSRSWNTEALVLSISQFTGDYRNVQLLVPQDGSCAIISAVLFGGARSKLRGMVVPYQSGRIWLYSNPIKNSHKITDFSVSAYRIELRESLVRSWCAAVCSEVTVKVCGTVDWQLIHAFLDGLCVSDDEGCRRGLLRFLWRLLHTAGIAPDFVQCGNCGLPLLTENPLLSISAAGTPEQMQGTVDSVVAKIAAVYSSAEDACFCSSCRHFDAYTFPLSDESLAYLYAVSCRPAGYSRSLPLSSGAYGELKRVLFFLTEKMIGSQLKTLQIAAGLL